MEKIQCPFCSHCARKDNLKRHIGAVHLGASQATPEAPAPASPETETETETETPATPTTPESFGISSPTAPTTPDGDNAQPALADQLTEFLHRELAPLLHQGPEFTPDKRMHAQYVDNIIEEFQPILLWYICQSLVTRRGSDESASEVDDPGTATTESGEHPEDGDQETQLPIAIRQKGLQAFIADDWLIKSGFDSIGFEALSYGDVDPGFDWQSVNLLSDQFRLPFPDQNHLTYLAGLL